MVPVRLTSDAVSLQCVSTTEAAFMFAVTTWRGKLVLHRHRLHMGTDLFCFSIIRILASLSLVFTVHTISLFAQIGSVAGASLIQPSLHVQIHVSEGSLLLRPHAEKDTGRVL